METAKITLIETVIGIWLIAAVVVAGGIFFVPNPLSYTLGEIVGSATASLMMLHLYRNIDMEMDMPRKRAVTHARITSAVRSVLEILVLAGSFFISEWVLPYTVLAGLFGRKFAVLLVPVMERVRTGREKNSEQQKGENITVLSDEKEEDEE